MASIYKRPRSPFWWIKFEDAAGRLVRQSLKLRWSSLGDTKKAGLIRAKHEILELDRRRGDVTQRWQAWVPEFLQVHYQNPLTLGSYRISWGSIEVYLRWKEIHFPAQLTYADCVGYVAWRAAGDKRLGMRAVCQNTALCDLKVLAVLMKEAVRRGFCNSNPVASLGIRLQKPKIKPEISEEHLQLIHARLKDEPEWMLTSFLIALYTGCRISETWIAMECVDLDRRQIHFATPKGGRPFSVPMRDELVPVFSRLAAAGVTHTYERVRLPSLAWCKFFGRIGLPQYSFHCLRVTFVSRGARAGVDERAMRRLVNHAGSTIHRVYQRFAPDDLREPLSKIPLPRLE